MNLLSVNVAIPTVVASNGQRVKTSIFKKSVAGPVLVRGLNLEGDEQSDLRVHGGTHKAVYAYSAKNAEHWREYLQRDDLGPGSFGENLTVEGLTDPEIAVGDELEIGTARFIVTQPRIPCFKLGIALGMPRFPKIFHWAGRNGFYLRVLKEGQIEAGDEIRVARARDPRMTIAELVQLSNSKILTPTQLERILALDALTPSWKEDFLERAAQRAHSK
ncbi:MAG: MOSC domain-containing protein [Acidobacteria bacterium]|nr:MOSC domain-containing protein [Acidobacteriota bacterium]